MADPVTKKIDALADLVGIAASGDKMVVIDASDSDPVTKTKLVAMNQLSIHTASQLATDVVENSQIKDGAVTAAKIAATTITAAQIAAKTITAAQIADNTITASQIATDGVGNAEIADGAVTQAKLSGIVRTVIIPIAGDEDDIIVKNYPRKSAWAAMLDTHTILSVAVVISGAVSSSGVVTVAVSNAGGVAATVSVPQGSWSASTTTIATDYKTAAAFAPIGVNVTAAGVGAKGLSVYLEVLG